MLERGGKAERVGGGERRVGYGRAIQDWKWEVGWCGIGQVNTRSWRKGVYGLCGWVLDTNITYWTALGQRRWEGEISCLLHFSSCVIGTSGLWQLVLYCERHKKRYRTISGLRGCGYGCGRSDEPAIWIWCAFVPSSARKLIHYSPARHKLCSPF